MPAPVKSVYRVPMRIGLSPEQLVALKTEAKRLNLKTAKLARQLLTEGMKARGILLPQPR